MRRPSNFNCIAAERSTCYIALTKCRLWYRLKKACVERNLPSYQIYLLLIMKKLRRQLLSRKNFTENCPKIPSLKWQGWCFQLNMTTLSALKFIHRLHARSRRMVHVCFNLTFWKQLNNLVDILNFNKVYSCCCLEDKLIIRIALKSPKVWNTYIQKELYVAIWKPEKCTLYFFLRFGFKLQPLDTFKQFDLIYKFFMDQENLWSNLYTAS